MIHIEVDTQAEIEKIAKRLEWQAIKAPDVLRLSINAAARKVRKQIPDNVEDAYTIDPSVLKDRKRGAPTVQTAKPGNIMAVIRSKGPVNELSDFLTEEGSRGVKTKVRKDGGKKLLERAGATAFKVTFRSTHMAILPPVFPARAREQREHEPDPAAVVPKGNELRPGDGGGGGPGGGVDEQLPAPDPGVEIRRGRVRGVRGRLKI